MNKEEKILVRVRLKLMTIYTIIFFIIMYYTEKKDYQESYSKRLKQMTQHWIFTSNLGS